MAERTAHLVDHVFPDEPVRQWVMSVPHPIRYVLAWRHDLCRRVARMRQPAVERHLRGWVRDQGLADPRGGGVAVIQRFGGSVNLHVHVHALVLDAVFARTTSGALRFHATPAPSAADMADILSAPAVRRLLARHGLDDEDGTAVDRSPRPTRAGWAAASVRGLAASGGSLLPLEVRRGQSLRISLLRFASIYLATARTVLKMFWSNVRVVNKDTEG